jgi:hypothetical protein
VVERTQHAILVTREESFVATNPKGRLKSQESVAWDATNVTSNVAERNQYALLAFKTATHALDTRNKP